MGLGWAGSGCVHCPPASGAEPFSGIVELTSSLRLGGPWEEDDTNAAIPDVLPLGHHRPSRFRLVG